ncbi:MAG TPA: DPP IV N-terminal domain-containing protein [Gemmatimonadaceae bacterium]|nr:DPP IV N-terminal domain-containing protein [Gemmatimonadaceae bacterium]
MRCPTGSQPRAVLLLLPLALAVSLPALAQTRREVTAQDYDRAVRMLAPAVNPLVVGGTAPSLSWLPDGRFHYRSVRPSGTEFVLVDPRAKSRTPLFDHVKLAAAVGAATNSATTPGALPFQVVDLSDDGRNIAFNVGGRRYRCDVAGTTCTNVGRATAAVQARAVAVTSPDGKRAAFIRDWNLWVRDVASGAETQLTTDGAKDFGYATDNAGWTSSDRAILLWSPDSRKIATQQQDERNVGEMHLVQTKVGHPVLRSWKYPLPGDSVVAMVHRVVIDVDSRTVVRLKMPPDFHRSTLGDDISMRDYAFNPDGSKLALVSTSRDHKVTTFRLADTRTGDVRTVFEETVPTHFESRTGWRVLWATNEVIWNSQRSDWSQLYLYDLTTGRLKNAITSGEGPVSSIEMIDEKSRTVWYGAQGRERGQDPYLRHHYRIGLDGKNATSLTPDDGDHTVQLSPDGRWIVDTWSRADLPPQTVLRDDAGRLVLTLETADATKLMAHGWKPPVLFNVKAADGTTDIYGQLYRPTNFDSTRKYPIVNKAYPGPQTGSVGSRAFAAAHGDNQALAELGFVVVAIDGRGSAPGRSKSFHDAYYGRMGRDNTIPDQVAGMQNLAKRYAWIDIDRAAMWGHSGGGFITAGAMFRFPDFFKVGIAESGNHDQRNYEDDWGERYQGLMTPGTSASMDSYDIEANQLLAQNLKGHLLLAHGTMDNNVPPDNTLLVVDALIKANKDFDLLMIPNAAHGFGAANNYMMRRRWDYFVRWLLDADPPKEYIIR